MIVYLPEEKDKALTEVIRPYGWEHLAGGFKWYRFIKGELGQHDEYGAVAYIETIGKIGEIAAHISKYGKVPSKAILLSGKPGIGKTLFAELLAATYLSEKRTAVTYTTDSGVKVTLVDKDGNAFLLNPIDKGAASRKSIRKAIATPQSKSNPYIRFYNASPMSKSDIETLGTDLRADMSVPGRKGRVFIVSEIDNIGKIQSTPLKVALDPANMPDKVLFIADTNYLDKTRKNLDEAGIERFSVIPIQDWSIDELSQYAKAYVNHFDIEFSKDPTLGFPEEDPYQSIAESCNGSMRMLLRRIQSLRSHNRLITREDVDIIKNDTPANVFQSNNQAFQFVHSVKNTAGSSQNAVIPFVTTMSRRQANLHSFVKALSFHLIQNFGATLNNKVISESLESLFNLMIHDGEPAVETQWAAATYHLCIIGDTLKNSGNF